MSSSNIERGQLGITALILIGFCSDRDQGVLGRVALPIGPY